MNLYTLVEKLITQKKKGSEMKHQYKCLPRHFFIVEIETNPNTLFLCLKELSPSSKFIGFPLLL
jgi:hypothetical protein